MQFSKKQGHIVAAVELTTLGEKVLQAAWQRSQELGARLSVVHVVEEAPARYWDWVSWSPPFPVRELHDLAHQWLSSKLASLNIEEDSVHLEVVHQGKPVEQILQFCEQNQCDMIFLGQRESSFLEQVFLGKTGQALLRNMKIPVWFVHPNSAQSPERILVPLEFSQVGRDALEAAIPIAKQEGAELHLVHVCEWLVMNPFVRFFSEEERQRTIQELHDPVMREFRNFLVGIDLHGVSYRMHLADGHIPREVLRASQRLNVDLIVTASKRASDQFVHILGSNTEYILQGSPCSVFVAERGRRPGAKEPVGSNTPSQKKSTEPQGTNVEPTQADLNQTETRGSQR